jgi:hypothetical protein
MKTLIAQIDRQARPLRAESSNSLWRRISVNVIFVTLKCSLVATVTMILALWASYQGSPEVVAAAGFTSGFVFLGAAVDNKGKAALLQLATGVALMFLGWATFSLSTEFIIISGLLVVAWLVFLVIGASRRLR